METSPKNFSGALDPEGGGGKYDRILKRIYAAEQQQGLQSYRDYFSWFDAAESGHADKLHNIQAIKGNIELRREDGKTGLMLAAACGHETAITSLLVAGYIIDEWDWNGDNALILAAANGHEQVVKLLLDKGADVEGRNQNGDTALTLAAANSHEQVMKLLLEKGADAKRQNLNGDTAFTLAAANGHEKVMKLLLDKGADAEGRDWNGDTALTLAAANGHEQVMKLLLDKGADAEGRNWNGDTALTLAAANGHEQVMKLLLDKGADAEGRNWNGDTALTLAAANGHEQVMKLLLEKGADAEERDSNGDTALTLATANCHEQVIRLLRKRKREPSISFSHFANPAQASTRKLASPSRLINAATNGHESIVKMFLDVDHVRYHYDRAKESALIAAATNGYESIVRMLFDDGHMRYGYHRAKESALIAAATNGYESIVRMLFDDGHMHYGYDRANESALIAAATNGHESIVKTLLDDVHMGYGYHRAKESALIAAATNGHESIVRMLLQNLQNLQNLSPVGSGRLEVDHEREIPWSKAVQSAMLGAASGAHKIIVDTLLSYNIRSFRNSLKMLAVIDSKGRTILHSAVHYGYENLAETLLDSGADVGVADRSGMTPLFEAALSGVTPIDLHPSSGISLLDPSNDQPAFHLMKLQLGLYTIGNEYSDLQRHVDSIQLFEDSRSLYEFGSYEFARALISPGIQFGHMDGPPMSVISDWGEFLLEAHIRLTLDPAFSAVLRLDRFIGRGSQILGSHYLKIVIDLERKIGRSSNTFRQWSFLNASPLEKPSKLQQQQTLACNMALLYLTCDNEMKRAKAIFNRIPTQPSAGDCWRDAFGDVLDLKINGTNPSNRLTWVSEQAAGAKSLINEDDKFNKGLSASVFSTLEDLANALRIHSRAVRGDIHFLRGLFGTCVLVGSLKQHRIPLWHVCSIEEASLIAYDPQKFSGLINYLRGKLAQSPSQENSSNLESLTGPILVGALVEPTWCSSVVTNALFQAKSDGVNSGRTAVNQSLGLKFERLTGQAQLSFGAQGPQGTIAIGGGVSKPGIPDQMITENSITTLEKAFRSWILVYQASNGQFVEQNLYSVASCVLQDISTPQSITTDFDQIPGATEWKLRCATLCRVCANVMSDPMPAEINETLGGLDLRELAQSCVKSRVWETPKERPGWVQVLGSLPTVSVDSIRPRSNCFRRCTVLITVAGLERRVGKLFKHPENDTLFESPNGTRLSLTGFISVSLDDAKAAAVTAKNMKWTDEKKLIVASSRFGGQGPSTLNGQQFYLIPSFYQGLKAVNFLMGFGTTGKSCSSKAVRQRDSLGQILHGSDLERDCVGLLVECF